MRFILPVKSIQTSAIIFIVIMLFSSLFLTEDINQPDIKNHLLSCWLFEGLSKSTFRLKIS
ncbi:hypothetical protein CUC53_02055 [Aeromonas cavernicola]|uniref:Uncharacterized protein n=1 Tax=Aeromonas cavernicola TaxID=1006623 RepID=A0A2H9U8T1_9GAMM|nr:hypothetical protein CUC53_02055 [Aeromonas cavernicola]